MNEGNLIPINKRSKNEAREISQKGGQKSGETRRRNRDIKNIVAALLEAKPDGGTVDRLKSMGIADDDITNKTALVFAMFQEAQQGNVKAFETLMKYAGEDPEQQRKDLEMQMKRDTHILVLNDKDYSAVSFDQMLSGDEQKQQVLLALRDNYRELHTANDEYMGY